MSNVGVDNNQDDMIESALLEADLFLKYKAPQRAIEKLRWTLEQHPRSVVLRERLREIAISYRRPEEAARQCLALANLYIVREDFDAAHERLLEAKQLDTRISIATGLEAIRRARRPDIDQARVTAAPCSVTLAGELSAVSIFDIVQVIENSRMTGVLAVIGGEEEQQTRILFNEGRIVGAEAEDASGTNAFRRVIEITNGTFNFERSAQDFPVTIETASNTNLMLDTLRQLDEEKV